ncbi:hypothetical protein MMC13_004605 [Lambiella insularis]|nr:hypothetical protein [Lambiella insularis]
MPAELEDLYAHTLKRITLEYRQESYIMLQIVLCTLSPLRVSAFLNCTTYIRWGKRSDPNATEDNIIRRLTSRCGGLLEVFPAFKPRGAIPVSRVQFIHQTVKEFVHNLKAYQELCGYTDQESGYLYLLRYGLNFQEPEEEISSSLLDYAKLIETDHPQDIDDMMQALDHDAAFFGWIQNYIDTVLTNSSQLAYYKVLRTNLVHDSLPLCFAVAAGFSEYVRRKYKPAEWILHPTGYSSGQSRRPRLLHIAAGAPALAPNRPDRPAMVKLLLELGAAPSDKSWKLLLASAGIELKGHPYPTLDLVMSKDYEMRTKDRFLIARELLQHGAGTTMAQPPDYVLPEHGADCISHCARCESGGRYDEALSTP